MAHLEKIAGVLGCGTPRKPLVFNIFILNNDIILTGLLQNCHSLEEQINTGRSLENFLYIASARGKSGNICTSFVFLGSCVVLESRKILFGSKDPSMQTCLQTAPKSVLNKDGNCFSGVFLKKYIFDFMHK